MNLINIPLKTPLLKPRLVIPQLCQDVKATLVLKGGGRSGLRMLTAWPNGWECLHLGIWFERH